MAQPVPAPTPIATFGAPVTVLGKEFVAPYSINLAMVRKKKAGSFVVTDSNGTIILNVKGHSFTMHDRRELLDASGRTLVTLHKKVFSLHDRWRAYRGESTDDEDLLFMVKRPKSSSSESKTKMHVFLGQNPNEHVWDYRIDGSWSEKSCVIYAGNTNDMVAQMRALIGKDHFSVTVYPNIDYVFIVALVLISDGTTNADYEKDVSGGVLGVIEGLGQLSSS